MLGKTLLTKPDRRNNMKFKTFLKEAVNLKKVDETVRRKLKFKHTDNPTKFKTFKYEVGDSWQGGDGTRLMQFTIAAKQGGNFYIAHSDSGNSMSIIPVKDMGVEVKRTLMVQVQIKQWAKEAKQNEKDEAQRLIDRVSLHGYEKGQSKLNLGKIAKALEEKITVNGKTWLMRDWVYDMIMNQKATTEPKGFALDGMIYKMKSKIPLNYGNHLETEYEEQLNPSDNYASDDDMASLFGN